MDRRTSRSAQPGRKKMASGMSPGGLNFQFLNFASPKGLEFASPTFRFCWLKSLRCGCFFGSFWIVIVILLIRRQDGSILRNIPSPHQVTKIHDTVTEIHFGPYFSGVTVDLGTFGSVDYSLSPHPKKSWFGLFFSGGANHNPKGSKEPTASNDCQQDQDCHLQRTHC